MGDTARKGRTGAFRRYPALILVGAAAALAILLPSALTVPQSGPSTLAEFAPVPGSGEGRSDVSEFGQGISGGLGFGSGRGGAIAPPPEQVGAPKQGKATLKRCVGNPPRQTEDPLSPPCVAFFEGNNGGATGKGVTKDEVSVVGRLANLTADSPTSPSVDCAEPMVSSDTLRDTYCKAYMRYFNERYQTYGRRVHLWSSHGGSEATLDQRFSPFAWVEAQGASTQAAERKSVSVGFLGRQRNSYQTYAPHLISFRADLEDQARIGAAYICQKLVGRKARYSGTPTDREKIRKFALWYQTDNAERDRLESALKSQCDFKFDDYQSNAGNVNSGAHLASARFREKNITSVVLLMEAQAHVSVTTLAAQSGYFPEWVIPGMSAVHSYDTNSQGRLGNQAQWANAFGITFDYRRDAIKDQSWYRAYHEMCQECPDPNISQSEASAIAYVYDSLTMLFYGIQAAGPRLTVENLDKGLHAIPQQGSPNPYKPAAYFGAGNYSFLKDAMMISWDPSGLPPGSSTAGCYRLPLDGQRFRGGDWTSGDHDVRLPGPCQGTVFGD